MLSELNRQEIADEYEILQLEQDILEKAALEKFEKLVFSENENAMSIDAETEDL